MNNTFFTTTQINEVQREQDLFELLGRNASNQLLALAGDFFADDLNRVGTLFPEILVPQTLTEGFPV